MKRIKIKKALTGTLLPNYSQQFANNIQPLPNMQMPINQFSNSFTNQYGNIPYQNFSPNSLQQLDPVAKAGNNMLANPSKQGFMSNFGAVDAVGAVGGLFKAGQLFKQEKEMARKAKQTSLVVKAQRNAANSIDVDLNNKNRQLAVSLEDYIVPGFQQNPYGGGGVNPLAKNGIALNSAPLTIKKIVKYQPGVTSGKLQGKQGFYLYDKLPTDPTFDYKKNREFVDNNYMMDVQKTQQWKEYVNNTKKNNIANKSLKNGGPVLKALNGFESFANAGGLDAAGQLLGAGNQNSGGVAGEALGTALSGGNPLIGKAVGIVGNTLMNAFGPQKQTKRYTRQTERDSNLMMAESGIQNFRGNYDFTMKNGGELYNNSSEEYFPIQSQEVNSNAFGGQLQTLWGGGVKEIAQNPYLQGNDKIVEFEGNSHEETNNNNLSGIGASWNNFKNGSEMSQASAEVQDGETGTVNQEGELNIGGALKPTLKMANKLGDAKLINLAKKYNGIKVQDIVKKEGEVSNKLNNKIAELEYSTINNEEKNKFDSLRKNTNKFNMYGFDKQLQNSADVIDTAINFQTGINNAANSLSNKVGYKVSADHLAKYGTLKKDKDPITKNNTSKYGNLLYNAQEGVNSGALPYNEEDAYIEKLKNFNFLNTTDYSTNTGNKKETPVYNIDTKKTDEESSMYKGLKPWQSALFNLGLDALRSENSMPYDRAQDIPKFNALSQNQLQPVFWQNYQPESFNENSSISFQDQINEINSQAREAQRLSRGNPALQPLIAAETYKAIQKTKADELRANLQQSNDLNAKNIALRNDAKLKNISLRDQNEERRQKAISNTKQVQQEVLNAMTFDRAQHQAASNKFDILEKRTNYRFDSRGNAINLNPLHYFDTSGSGAISSKGSGLAPGYEFTYDDEHQIIGTHKANKKDSAKFGKTIKFNNGSLLKEFRNK